MEDLGKWIIYFIVKFKKDLSENNLKMKNHIKKRNKAMNKLKN
jgi:hypothetical protein